jgi:hypothetical protein
VFVDVGQNKGAGSEFDGLVGVGDQTFVVLGDLNLRAKR